MIRNTNSMDLDDLFEKLKLVLIKHSSDLDIFNEFVNSKAKIKKNSLHLYGKKSVDLFGKKQHVFLVGIIRQKHYVGFYFSPIYSDPDQFELSDDLTKVKHGKTCFYLKDESLIDQVEALLVKGKILYQQKGWI